ncbi:MAG: FAD-binding oxidoreductase [Gammaproteobacteria bacterium]|nr:FAD-binding oxidoreductase [Gammaproteobacteria bacterium]
MTSRRGFMQAMSMLPLLAGCTSIGNSNAANFTPSGVPIRRVLVEDNRVIRTVAGLRPFRSAGFVVKAETFDDKLVIHNYGHGGGGITLSWGTAHLAMQMAVQTEHKQCAVIGCGAVGLATARLLQNQGWQVTIYAKDLPPNTTSNIAGGQWSPTSVYDDEYVTPAFALQFEEAMRLAYGYFQNLVGPRYGVRWISNYTIGSEPAPSDNFNDRHAGMYPQLMDIAPGRHPFAAPYVRHYDTMLIEPAIYLPAMLQDFHAAGGNIQVVDFADRQQVLSLAEPVILNCSGLGARDLFNDQALIPIKGQLSILLPQEEVDYMIIGNGGLYMFPRHDGILLGGTFERNQWSTEPDPVASRRILDGHSAFFRAMHDPWATNE